MALTNLYASVVDNEFSFLDTTTSNMHAGTSSTSTDHVEVRMMTNDGTNPTNITKFQVIKALEKIIRHLKNGGLVADGTNVPIL